MLMLSPCRRRHTVDLLRTVCEHTVLGLLPDIHDGEPVCDQLDAAHGSHSLSIHCKASPSAGICVGAAASICKPKFPGHIQFHGAVSAMGAIGVQCCAEELTCSGLVGHAGRC